MNGTHLTLLIVDDHALVRDGLASVLAREAPETRILQAGDLPSALRAAEETPGIDAVLLDLLLPGVRGTEALAAFRTRFPGLPVLVLSASEDPAHVRAALAGGALGYLPKSAAAATLRAALAMVLAGEIYVPALMAGGRAGESAPACDPRRLTGRQGDVLRLLVEGRANKEIARTLGLAEKTVKAHVTAVLRLLDAANRTEAAVRARDMGLL